MVVNLTEGVGPNEQAKTVYGLPDIEMTVESCPQGHCTRIHVEDRVYNLIFEEQDEHW